MPYDVIILGGGSAGTAAAVASARSGAHTALIEQSDTLGGLAVSAMVGTICGLYLRHPEQRGKYVSEGFPRAFAQQLQRASQSEPMIYKEGLQFLPYSPPAFSALCENLLKKEQVDLLKNHPVQSCSLQNHKISSVNILGNTLTAKAFVDCSGQATLSTFAGAKVIHPQRKQASAIVFSLSGIQPTEEHLLRMTLLRDIMRAVKHKKIPTLCERLSIIPGSYKKGTASFKLGLPLTEDSSKEKAQALVSEVSTFMCQHIDLFKQASLTSIAPHIGVRSATRPKGKQTLSTSHVLAAKKSKEGVARGAWPIEFWDDAPRPHMDYLPMNDYYDIPAETLQSQDISNLFFAGKSFSASDEAIASARVIGTCLGTGYAAGTLAAFHVLQKPQQNAIDYLRAQLDKTENQSR